MNQALMLLAKKGAVSSSGQGVGSSSGVKSPARGRAEKIFETAVEVNEGGGDLVPRSSKRGRDMDDDGQRRTISRKTLDPIRFGPGKSLTITSSRRESLPPVLQGSTSIPPLRIEVQPSEKWSAGSNFPVQVFKAFNLPQDFNAYVDKSRDEVAERCLARGGRFLADLAHIITDYRADVDRRWREGSVRELAEMKEEKAAAVRRAEEAERLGREQAEELKKIKLENDELKEAVKSKEVEVGELGARVTAAVAETDAVRSELSILKGANEVFEKTIVDLKLDLKKSIEDLAKGIGTGYQGCYERLQKAGIDLSGHSFDDYCADLAKSLPLDTERVEPAP